MSKLTKVFIIREDTELAEELIGNHVFWNMVRQLVEAEVPGHDRVGDDIVLVIGAWVADGLDRKFRFFPEDDESDGMELADQLNAIGGVGSVIKNIISAKRSIKTRDKVAKIIDEYVYDVSRTLARIDDTPGSSPDQFGAQEAQRDFNRELNHLAKIARGTGKLPNYNSPRNDVLKLSNGWVWRDVCGEENQEAEGGRAQHCGAISAPGNEMYSLRDGKGRPHVTVEFNPKSKTILQLKGKQNNQPIDAYIPACKQLIQHLGATKFREVYNTDPMETRKVALALGFKPAYDGWNT